MLINKIIVHIPQLRLINQDIMETMSQFNSQEASAIRDKKLKPVQLNCLYCIIKCERHSVALYYLVKEGD